MDEFAQIAQEFREYVYPGMNYALMFDRSWLDAYVSRCTEVGLALVGFSWFLKDNGGIASKGSFETWGGGDGATWQEYLNACNSSALAKLKQLPQDTALVSFEGAVEPSWWQVKQRYQEWEKRLDSEHSIAYFNGKQVILESRLANTAGMKMSGGCLSTFWWVGLIPGILAIINLARSCSHNH